MKPPPSPNGPTIIFLPLSEIRIGRFVRTTYHDFDEESNGFSVAKLTISTPSHGKQGVMMMVFDIILRMLRSGDDASMKTYEWIRLSLPVASISSLHFECRYAPSSIPIVMHLWSPPSSSTLFSSVVGNNGFIPMPSTLQDMTLPGSIELDLLSSRIYSMNFLDPMDTMKLLQAVGSSVQRCIIHGQKQFKRLTTLTIPSPLASPIASPSTTYSTKKNRVIAASEEGGRNASHTHPIQEFHQPKHPPPAFPSTHSTKEGLVIAASMEGGRKASYTHPVQELHPPKHPTPASPAITHSPKEGLVIAAFNQGGRKALYTHPVQEFLQQEGSSKRLPAPFLQGDERGQGGEGKEEEAGKDKGAVRGRGGGAMNNKSSTIMKEARAQERDGTKGGEGGGLSLLDEFLGRHSAAA